jgi:SAM-dependent methyltransferase
LVLRASLIELAKTEPALFYQRPSAEIFTEKDGKAVLDGQRVTHLYPHESYDIPLPDGSADYVFSHYGFEHFNEPRKTIEAVYRILKPGGVTAHIIGILDHRDFAHPYEYFKLDEAAWRDMMLKEGRIHEFTNRWVASRFKTAFEEVGFTILDFITEPDAATQAVFDCHRGIRVTEADRASFHPDFQKYSLDDLSTTFVFVIAKKPIR